MTSSYGIEGFTNELFEAMKAYDIARVFIAYDRDDAGERGATTVAEKLSAEGIACFRVEFPKGWTRTSMLESLSPLREASRSR